MAVKAILVFIENIKATDYTALLQVVCAGVYLLTPSKRAYLRYYKDLEDDILGRRGHATADVESLMPGKTPADRKFAALANGLGDDAEEVGLCRANAC